MKRMLKKYFIPHNENDHKPHFLRETSVFVVASAVVISMFVTLLHSAVFLGSGFLASILPAVLVDLANQDRSIQGLMSLTVNPILTEAAQKKANDMAARGYFAHTSPSGVTPWFWFKNAGYQFTNAGENLAINFYDSKDIETAWMNSPGHRANILNKNFTEIGVAMAEGMYQGRQTTFVVQMFGHPASSNAFVPASVPMQAPKPVPAPVPVSRPTTEGEPLAANNLPESIQVKDASSDKDEFQVIAQDDMFIAVKKTAYSDVSEPVVSLPVGSAPHYASWFNRVASSPRHIINMTYVLLAALVSAALLLSVFIKIRKQHPKHIAYGLSLLALIGFAFYINKELVIAHMVIL